MRRPDIVLLVLDTQRRDRVSCYGDSHDTTPQLDAFAARATRFDTAFSPSHWTIPAHASLFTGMYPAQHGTVQSYSKLPESLPTLAERLRDGGYYTAAFCNNPLVGVVNNGLRRGFYSFLNYSGLLTSRPNQTGVPSGAVGKYRQWFKRIVMRVLNSIQDSFARSDAMLAFSFTPFMLPIWQTALSFKGNTTKSLDDAARLLTERRGLHAEQPVFAFINLMGVHLPYHPQREYVARHAPEVLKSQAARSYLRQFNSDVFGWLSPLTQAISPDHQQILSGMYNAEVAQQDAAVGTFFQRLQARGTLDQTLVIACADHGELLGEKSLVGHSISLYNQLTHVPLIIRDPSGDFTAGAAHRHVVSTRRIFQTALTAAGIASEAEQRHSLAQPATNDPDHGTALSDGFPLQNVLHMLEKRRPQLVTDRRVDQNRRAVIHDRYKLILTGENGVELFDIHDDPTEETNLSAILPEVTEDLQARLDASVPAFDHAGVSAASDDPQLRKRLHDLGYLE